MTSSKIDLLKVCVKISFKSDERVQIADETRIKSIKDQKLRKK